MLSIELSRKIPSSYRLRSRTPEVVPGTVPGASPGVSPPTSPGEIVEATHPAFSQGLTWATGPGAGMALGGRASETEAMAAIAAALPATVSALLGRRLALQVLRGCGGAFRLFPGDYSTTSRQA